MGEQIGSPEDAASFIAARHSIKPKGEYNPSEEYKGISEKGVELAREQAQKWLELLKNAPEKSVLLLSPTSEQIRTKSSMRAVAEEMKSFSSKDESSDVSIITEADFFDPKLTYNEMIGIITSKIEEAPDKKFVVSAPLFIKGFALGAGRWTDQKGNPTPYLLDLMERNGGDDQSCLEDWVANEGRSGDLGGPNPTSVAEEHLEGIKKLESFAKRYLSDRPIVVGAVGHSWNLDALAIYLANNGKVDSEGLEKVGGTMITEMEPIVLTSDENGEKLKYGERLEMPLH